MNLKFKIAVYVAIFTMMSIVNFGFTVDFTHAQCTTGESCNGYEDWWSNNDWDLDLDLSGYFCHWNGGCDGDNNDSDDDSQNGGDNDGQDQDDVTPPDNNDTDNETPPEKTSSDPYDIFVSKDADKNVVFPEDAVIFTIDIWNRGSSVLSSVSLEDELPDEFENIKFEKLPSNTSSDIDGNEITVFGMRIEPGKKIVLKYKADVKKNAGEKVVENTVKVKDEVTGEKDEDSEKIEITKDTSNKEESASEEGAKKVPVPSAAGARSTIQASQSPATGSGSLTMMIALFFGFLGSGIYMYRSFRKITKLS